MNTPFPPAPRPDAARLTVGIVSAGRVGSILGAALDRAGHDVTSVSAVSRQSRQRAATLLPSAAVRDPLEVASHCSLLVLAVPDDSLGPLVAGLAGTGPVRPGQLVAHTSGRHGLEILNPLTAQGALPLALHPAMTFVGDADTDLARLSGAPFGVTAPEELRVAGEALVMEMGGEPFWVPDAARPLYHAAMAHGANHLVTLVCQAVEALAQAGIDRPERMLAPLLTAALDNALDRGDVATTGPVVRGDSGTVASHLAVLAEQSPQTVPAYLALARATADRALANGRLRPDDAGDLLDVLANRTQATA